MTDFSDQVRVHLQQQLDKLGAAEEVERLIRELPHLVDSIRKAKLCSALSAASALMTIPELQPNLIRLESLTHLLAARAAGDIDPSREMLEQWINEDLGADIVTHAEDPVEDVFVSNVITSGGNRRLFTGTWVTPDFWLQNLLDVLSIAPKTAQLERIRNEVDSLLRLSEVVAERSGVKRFSISEGIPNSPIAIPSVPDLSVLSGRTRFSEAVLNEKGIKRVDLSPFLFDMRSRAQLEKQNVEESSIQRHPLIECGDHILLSIPEAIGCALRLHILERIATIGAATQTAFERALHGRQIHLLFGEALRFSAGTVDLSGELPPSSIDPKHLSQGAWQFDEGKFAHVVLLHDDWKEVLEAGLTSWKRPPEAFNKKLARYLESCARTFSGKPGYIGGMTVIVLGGVGRGFGMIPPLVPEGWTVSVWSLADIYALAWLEHEWLLMLWKLNREIGQALKNGIEVLTSDANVFSFWKENKYQLIPREYPVGSKHGSISLDPGYIASFRQQFRISFDAHGVYRPDEQRWIVVRKTFPAGFFKELQALPMYSSPDDAARGRLRGVIETGSRAWWLDAVTGGSEGDEREFQFHLWEAALNWLARLAPEVENRTLDLPVGNILVSLDLRKIRTKKSPSPGSVSSQASVNVSVSQKASTIFVRVEDDFLRLLQRPTNDAERELVRVIAEGAMRLAGAENPEELSNVICSSIITSSDARFIHAFTAPPSIRDELAQFDRPVGRRIQESNGALTTIGIGWEILKSNEEELRVSGREKCNEFLNAAVDCLWRRIREPLQELDRNQLVEQCLRNHEGIQLDRDVWRRTSRALAAVYKERDDVIRAAQKHEADFSRSTLSSRVLLEMALSTCPATGGRKPGIAEFDELLATVARLIAVAYDSDAMRAGLTEPTIRVFPNGQFFVSGKFYEETMLPYQSGHFAERFEEQIRKYPDLYKESGTAGRPVGDVFDQKFILAFEEEYGVPLQQLVHVASSLEERAVDDRRLVTKVCVKDLKTLLAKRVGLTSEQVNAFLRNFCLSPRKRWDSTPNGFAEKDWYPWRFRRRLSLMARPVVLTGFNEDDPAFYASGLVHDGFANLVVGSHGGGFDVEFFTGALMKAWIGTINNKRGHEFNEEVAEEFRKLGFQARASVQMTEFNVPSEMGDLGDIDVLAWNGSDTAYIVECKKLRFAMTVGEIVDQLNRFRGEANDELAKHMKRCLWLGQHPDRLAKTIRCYGSLELVPLLVTNTIVPMQFSQDLPIPSESIMPTEQLSQRLSRH